MAFIYGGGAKKHLFLNLLKNPIFTKMLLKLWS